MVNQLNQRVIISETPGQLILTEILRNEDLLSTLDLRNEYVFGKLNPPNESFQEKTTIHQVKRVEHLDSIELNLHRLLLELVAQELGVVLLLILLGLLVSLQVLEQVKNTVFLEGLEQLISLFLLLLIVDGALIFLPDRRLSVDWTLAVALVEVGKDLVIVDILLHEAINCFLPSVAIFGHVLHI